MKCLAGLALSLKAHTTNDPDDWSRYEFHRCICDVCRAEMRGYNKLAQQPYTPEQERAWQEEMEDGH